MVDSALRRLLVLCISMAIAGLVGLAVAIAYLLLLVP